jgi:hypothetical protein
MVCRNALKDINETWYAFCIYRLSDLWAIGLMGHRTIGRTPKYIISLEMPVPSQGHYGFHSFPVYNYEF